MQHPSEIDGEIKAVTVHNSGQVVTVAPNELDTPASYFAWVLDMCAAGYAVRRAGCDYDLVWANASNTQETMQ